MIETKIEFWETKNLTKTKNPTLFLNAALFQPLIFIHTEGRSAAVEKFFNTVRDHVYIYSKNMYKYINIVFLIPFFYNFPTLCVPHEIQKIYAIKNCKIYGRRRIDPFEDSSCS